MYIYLIYLKEKIHRTNPIENIGYLSSVAMATQWHLGSLNMPKVIYQIALGLMRKI